MTADEFEESIAARSGISVRRLRELGRIVRPCFCPEGDHKRLCEGWQSTTPTWYADDVRARLEGVRPVPPAPAPASTSPAAPPWEPPP